MKLLILSLKVFKLQKLSEIGKEKRMSQFKSYTSSDILLLKIMFLPSVEEYTSEYESPGAEGFILLFVTPFPSSFFFLNIA